VETGRERVLRFCNRERGNGYASPETGGNMGFIAFITLDSEVPSLLQRRPTCCLTYKIDMLALTTTGAPALTDWKLGRGWLLRMVKA
jgi:hypothetical protein